MEKVYVPKICKAEGDEKPEWEGSVTVKVPTVTEYIYIAAASTQLRKAIKDGAIEEDFLLAMPPLFPFLKKHLVKIDLREIKTGIHYDSFEALEGNMDNSYVMLELAASLSGGFKIEGESKPN